MLRHAEECTDLDPSGAGDEKVGSACINSMNQVNKRKFVELDGARFVLEIGFRADDRDDVSAQIPCVT